MSRARETCVSLQGEAISKGADSPAVVLAAEAADLAQSLRRAAQDADDLATRLRRLAEAEQQMTPTPPPAPASAIEPPSRQRVDSPMMDEDDLAKMLKVPAATIKFWRYRGSGPPYVKLPSRAVRYPRADALAWLEAGCPQQLPPVPPGGPDQLLSITDVAARYGIPTATLRTWRQRGAGPPGARLNGTGRLVFRAADVEAWVAAQVTGS